MVARLAYGGVIPIPIPEIITSRSICPSVLDEGIRRAAKRVFVPKGKRDGNIFTVSFSLPGHLQVVIPRPIKDSMSVRVRSPKAAALTITCVVRTFEDFPDHGRSAKVQYLQTGQRPICISKCDPILRYELTRDSYGPYSPYLE